MRAGPVDQLVLPLGLVLFSCFLLCFKKQDLGAENMPGGSPPLFFLFLRVDTPSDTSFGSIRLLSPLVHFLLRRKNDIVDGRSGMSMLDQGL